MMDVKGTLNVLHLEDEEALRDIVRTTITLLEPSSHLWQFVDSDAAVQFIDQEGQKIDLFLLDVRVPGAVDGVGVARKAREIGCNGLIAFTSAYQAPDPKQLQSLDYLWLPKPVDLLRMKSTLKRARGVIPPSSG
jgi:DNA-binding LytR/AlgR family response regulator